LLKHFRVDVGLQHEGGIAVSQVVKPEARQARPANGVLPRMGHAAGKEAASVGRARLHTPASARQLVQELKELATRMRGAGHQPG